MQYNSVLECLQILIHYKPSQAELCQILNVKQSTMSNRAVRNSNFTDLELSKLEQHYNVVLRANNVFFGPVGDRIEITYWDNLPNELKKSKVASVWFDREIVENDWEMSAENLCIIPMVGDKMSRYWYPIRSGDILIVDTSQNYIMGNGVYFATSQNNTRFWIREMQILFNNDVEFKGFSPSGDTTKIINSEQLKDAGFRIIGKVIKNVSFRL